MKFVATVVSDDDVNRVVETLLEHGFYITRLASTGGLLRAGNTVLLSGVEDDQVDPMLQIIKAHTEMRVQPLTANSSRDVHVSRAVAFVINLERLEKL